MNARQNATPPQSRFAALQRAVAGSTWAPLAGKVFLGALAFVVLSLVGSGAASGLFRSAPKNQDTHVAATVNGAQQVPVILIDGGPDLVEERPMDMGQGPDAGEAQPGDAGAVTADGKVVLNAASEEDLRRLPGIGATRARAIVTLRTRLGRFRRVEDLLRVKGLGRRSLARLRPLIVVNPP